MTTAARKNPDANSLMPRPSKSFRHKPLRRASQAMRRSGADCVRLRVLHARHSLIKLSRMEQRVLGRTGRAVSVVGLGTWQLGADWGSVDERDALAVLAASVEAGVTFFDTADVYGDGR